MNTPLVRVAVCTAIALLAACADRDPTAPSIPETPRADQAAAPTPAGAGPQASDAILFSGAVIDKKTKERSYQILRANPDGSGLTQITSGPGTRRWPAWSKDRTKIAFVAAVGDQLELYVMNADGSGQKRLTSTAGWHEKHPVFMPNGQQIVYERTRKFGTGDTLKAEVRIVDVTGANDKDPGWSNTCVSSPSVTCPLPAQPGDPGQREPTVFENSTTGLQLVTMSARHPLTLTHDFVYFTPGHNIPTWLDPVQSPNRVQDPHWSPDGFKLAFTLGGTIMVWSSQTGQVIASISYKDPVTQKGVALSDPSWSPDSKLLVAKAANGGLAIVDPYIFKVTPLFPTAYSYGEPSWTR